MLKIFFLKNSTFDLSFDQKWNGNLENNLSFGEGEILRRTKFCGNPINFITNKLADSERSF